MTSKTSVASSSSAAVAGSLLSVLSEIVVALAVVQLVQCPMDALSFEDENGARVEPETIRRFKLNLLGKRAVDAGPRVVE